MIEPGVALSTLAYTGMGGFGFGASFLVVRWFASFTAGRIDKKEADIDEATVRLITGLERRLNEEIENRRQTEGEMRSELRDVREQLAECNRKHAESEAEVGRLRAQMQGFGEARDRAAVIVAAEKKEAKG